MVKFGNIPTKLRKKGLEDKLMRVCKDNDVVFMSIFGFYVRGEQKRGSDIDIAIRYRKVARKSLFDLVELPKGGCYRVLTCQSRAAFSGGFGLEGDLFYAGKVEFA